MSFYILRVQQSPTAMVAIILKYFICSKQTAQPSFNECYIPIPGIRLKLVVQTDHIFYPFSSQFGLIQQRDGIVSSVWMQQQNPELLKKTYVVNSLYFDPALLENLHRSSAVFYQCTRPGYHCFGVTES